MTWLLWSLCTCDLQEKNFECHSKSQWVRQHPMGAGSVPSVVLDHLLLLCLERSEVHWEGRTLDFCMFIKYQAALNLLKENGITTLLEDNIILYSSKTLQSYHLPHTLPLSLQFNSVQFKILYLTPKGQFRVSECANNTHKIHLDIKKTI